MALRAWHVGVPVRQQEPGGAVVECGGGPRSRRVALRAIRCGKRWSRLRVWWIVGLLPGAQVAAGVTAIVRRNLQIVVVVDVAAGARNIGMASSKRKTGGRMVELGVQERVEVVASLTVCRSKRRPGRSVRRVGGVLPVLQVTGITLRRKTIEDSGGKLFVTFVALNRGVCSQ